MPTAKKEANTSPKAVSSFSRVVWTIKVTSAPPINPAKVAPIKIANGSLLMFHMNPSATPGNTACDSVSPNSAIFRTTIKLPSNPQLIPNKMEPINA